MSNTAQQPLRDDEAAFELDDDGPVDVVQVFKRYVDLRLDFEAKDAVATAAKRLYKAQEERLWQLMENLEMKKFSHDELGTITRVNKLIGSVVDGVQFTRYLVDRGEYEEFRSWRWAQARINERVKETMAETGEAPPGLAPITPIQLSWRRPKGEVEAQEVEVED